MCKATKLLYLLRLLRNPCTTRELAERLGVSQRTVQRYLLDLQAEPLYMPLVQDGRKWRMFA